jgi:hypothetical protein
MTSSAHVTKSRKTHLAANDAQVIRLLHSLPGVQGRPVTYLALAHDASSGSSAAEHTQKSNVPRKGYSNLSRRDPQLRRATRSNSSTGLLRTTAQINQLLD